MEKCITTNHPLFFIVVKSDFDNTITPLAVFRSLRDALIHVKTLTFSMYETNFHYQILSVYEPPINVKYLDNKIIVE